MESDKEIALYYPTIDISDEYLIKTTALYWDEMHTIVPVSIQHPYENKISIEAKKEKFLKPRKVHSCDPVVEQAGKEFLDDLLKYSQIKTNVLNYRDSMALEERRKSGIHWQKLSPLYFDKIPHEFRDAIESTDDFCMVPDFIGYSYMSRLAGVISQEDKVISITNIEGMHKILLDRYVSYAEERKQNQAQLACMTLQTLSVHPDTPLVDILGFRKTYHDELVKYRREIRKLTRGLHDLDTAEKQSELEEILKDEIIPVKSEIEAKLRSEEEFFMIANTVITVTAAGTILLSGGQAWLAAALQGVGSLGLNFYGNVRAERLITDHPIGYLCKVQQQFGMNQ